MKLAEYINIREVLRRVVPRDGVQHMGMDMGMDEVDRSGICNKLLIDLVRLILRGYHNHNRFRDYRVHLICQITDINININKDKDKDR